MKTLLLMRHAKSSWKDTTISDHERPLAKRGLRDSNRMGEMLTERELTPQMILSSSAVRAAETARIINEVCGCKSPINLLDSLYLAEADSYVTELSKLPDDLERVMVIGHNPGIESLLQVLSGLIESLPTAVIAYLSLPIQRWTDLSPATDGELIDLWRPKELPEEEKADHKKEKKEEKLAKKPAKEDKKEEKAARKPEKEAVARPKKEAVAKPKKETLAKPKKETVVKPKPAKNPVKKEKKKSAKK